MFGEIRWRYTYFYYYYFYAGCVAQLINLVTLRRARLVLGWVTARERVNHLGI